MLNLSFRRWVKAFANWPSTGTVINPGLCPKRFWTDGFSNSKGPGIQYGQIIPNQGARAADRYNLFVSNWSAAQAFVGMICISEETTIHPENERRVVTNANNLVLLIRGAHGFLVDIAEDTCKVDSSVGFHQRATAILYNALGVTAKTQNLTMPSYRSAVSFASVRFEGRNSGKEERIENP